MTDTSAQTDCRALVEEAWQAVNDAYRDPEFGGVNWNRALQDALPRCDSGDSAHVVIRSMLRVLDEPAVRWISAERAVALPAEFAGAPSPGIGLIELLSIDIDERTRLLTIVTPVPGSPAAIAGLRPGDVIESIDGVRSDTMALADAVDRLRGEPGTTVVLGARRGRTSRTLTITRAAVTAEPAVEQRVVTALGQRFGYIRFNRFMPGSGQALAAAVDTVERAGITAIVLDLRDNPGGLVQELITAADVFLPRRQIIATIAGRPGNPTVLTAPNTQRTLLPLAVLIDHGTASAAEALSAVLQATDRGLVIGNARTFGKGLAHSIQPLSDSSAVMVPVGRLLTPDARDILAQGVEPTLRIQSSDWPVLDPGIEAGTMDDAAFRRAVRFFVEGR